MFCLLGNLLSSCPLKRRFLLGFFIFRSLHWSQRTILQYFHPWMKLHRGNRTFTICYSIFIPLDSRGKSLRPPLQRRHRCMQWPRWHRRACSHRRSLPYPWHNWFSSGSYACCSLDKLTRAYFNIWYAQLHHLMFILPVCHRGTIITPVVMMLRLSVAVISLQVDVNLALNSGMLWSPSSQSEYGKA